jgi:general secretion pathway protein I
MALVRLKFNSWRHHGRRARLESGFTLIEVLVALTIASVALLSALRATGSMALSSEELKLRTLAQWSAENQLSLIRIQGEIPQLGKRELPCMQADIPLNCQIEVFTMPAQAFRRVEVTVYGGLDNHRLVGLIGFSSQVGN